MKKLFYIFFILVFLVSGTGVLLLWLSDYQSAETVTLYFKKGSSLRSISQELQKNKVVPHARFFEFMVRLKKKEKAIRFGEYEFPAGISTLDVLKMMIEGKVLLHPFTIPEGLNLKEIEKLGEDRGMTTKEEWEELVQDAEWIQKLGVEAKNLEGYLFPDTYLIEKTTTAKELIAQMVGLFLKKVTPEMINTAKEKGFTLHQWATLASIVEKETGAATERPIIAGVFLNRLEKGMLLQSDPTVIYGIPNFDGNITRENLETDTPYNTYTRAGLPAGPICSPGFEALNAVINPVKNNYLYFVSKGDGTHQFSETLEEHNQAVQFYQLNKGTAPETGGQVQEPNQNPATGNQ